MRFSWYYFGVPVGLLVAATIAAGINSQISEERQDRWRDSRDADLFACIDDPACDFEKRKGFWDLMKPPGHDWFWWNLSGALFLSSLLGFFGLISWRVYLADLI